MQRAFVLAEQDEQFADGADATPASLRRFKLNPQPANADRSRGTHHFAAYSRRQSFDATRGRELILAVRNVNKWDTPGARQRYAFAIALKRDRDHADLYAELQLQLEAVTTIELDTEIQL